MYCILLSMASPLWLWENKIVRKLAAKELIGNMDHMRISGTEPSSVILGQTK